MRDMTYQEANALLTGRCKKSRRVWRHGVYIWRDGKDKISLRYWSFRRVMTWYKDGRKTIYKKGIRQWHNGSTTTEQIDHTGYGWFYAVNWFIGPWRIRKYRGRWLIANDDGGEWEIPRSRITIYPDGSTRKGKPFKQIRAELKRADYQRDKPRRRGRYWRRRARNLYVDRSKCVATTQRYRRFECKERYQFQRRMTPHVFECGCRTYRKNIKFDRTVDQILGERNATVRSAMIKLYGIGKFFDDANAKLIDTEQGYQLLELDRGEPDPGTPEWRIDRTERVIRAVKMVCPSTGEIHVNPVPGNIHTVPAAMDWIYELPNYLQRVGQQT